MAPRRETAVEGSPPNQPMLGDRWTSRIVGRGLILCRDPRKCSSLLSRIIPFTANTVGCEFQGVVRMHYGDVRKVKTLSSCLVGKGYLVDPPCQYPTPAVFGYDAIWSASKRNYRRSRRPGRLCILCSVHRVLTS